MKSLRMKSRMLGVAAGKGKRTVALLILCLGALTHWADAGEVGAVGDLYVTSDTESQVVQYDGMTGAFVGIFASSDDLVCASGLVFNSDGNLLVGSCANGKIIEYDGNSGAFIRVFASGNELTSPYGLTLGPNGNLFVADGANKISENSGRVLEYDGNSGAFIRVFAISRPVTPQVTDLAFGPNGNLFVTGLGIPGDHHVLEFDGTGAFVRIFTPGFELRAPHGLAFKPDGNLLVSSEVSDEIFEYDGTTGNLVRLFAEASNPVGMTLGPNGNLFVAIDFSDTVEQFDVVTGESLGVFVNSPGLLTRPWHLVFKPPASPVVVLIELVDEVLLLNLQQGIANNLDAKLNAVLQALEDANENNDVAAINALEAFIIAVQAQSGNHIPAADADALIAKAQAIVLAIPLP